MGIFNKIFGQKKDEKHKPKEANSLSTAPFASNNEENTNYETVCNNGKKAGAFDYVESVETVSKYVNMPTANEQNATTQTNKNDINPEPMKPLMMDQKVDPAVESNHFSATTQQEKNEQLQRFSRGKDFTDGVLEAIRLLIESGSDVNATDNDGFAPLHYLTCRESLDREENISPINKIEIIRMLVEAGADVNATDNDGFTPLHYLACQMNFSPEMFETMRLLIAAGADVNAEDGGAMYTPLFYFGEETNITPVRFDAMRMLIELGADTKCLDENTINILQNYFTSNNQNTGEKEGVAGWASLRIDHEKEYDDITKILTHKTTVEKTNEKSTLEIITPQNRNRFGAELNKASEDGDVEKVLDLLAAGADVDNVNDDSLTPLLQAVCEGYVKIVEALIAGGANVDKADDNGLTPLHYAVSEGRIKEVEALLAAGAVVDNADKDGYTPLHYAAYKGQIKAVEVLLIAGADVHRTEKLFGFTPLQLARSKEYDEIANILTQYAFSAKAKEQETAKTILPMDIMRSIDELTDSVKSLAEEIEAEITEANIKEQRNTDLSCFPFITSMNIGIHHIMEGVQQIEVMNMWTLDVPKGFVFSLDFKHTGKSLGGENRPLVIMIDNEYSDFLYPYQSEINFVVFATRQVDFYGQPLNSLSSREIITQMNESIKRTTRNYKFIVETDLISVQYVTVSHRKNDSEFNISIYTQDTWFLAQFLFNEPTLGKDERVKMVEDWLKTIEPLQKTSLQKNKSPEINTPEALKAQKFKTVSPSKNLYWHYDMLLNQKRGGLSRFAEVSINDSGTEFTCLDLDTVVPEDEYLEKVTFAADADRCNYRCHKAALEMSRVFRVAPNAFNYLHDREGEIREKTMRRAYNFSALRSFAWTLGAYQETEGLDEEQISIDVLLQLGEFVKSRDWLNYTDKSHYNGLCDGGDLLMFYLPDKTTPYLVKENVVEKDNVVSLDNLRNDLSALEPIMRQIHEHLHKNRERSQPLSTPLSDVLYAWCVLALAAEKAFFTEDGPMSCDYSQYND